MKTKLILELATGAALVALLVWQHSSLNQLRADNAALQKRLSEPAAVLAEPAPPAGGAADALELARLRNEHNELIRLRGKVGQQAELQSQLSAARQALDKNDQAEQAKELDTRMIQTTRNAAVVFRDFARHPGGFDPTNFDQVTAHYGQTHPDSMSRDPNWDLFEFVPHPKPVEQYPESVVLREKTPRQAPAGTWLRAYLTGDGSGFDLVSPTSDFSSQENRSPNVPGIWVEIPGSRGPTPANDARGRANPSSAR